MEHYIAKTPTHANSGHGHLLYWWLSILNHNFHVNNSRRWALLWQPNPQPKLFWVAQTRLVARWLSKNRTTNINVSLSSLNPINSWHQYLYRKITINNKAVWKSTTTGVLMARHFRIRHVHATRHADLCSTPSGLFDKVEKLFKIHMWQLSIYTTA